MKIKTDFGKDYLPKTLLNSTINKALHQHLNTKEDNFIPYQSVWLAYFVPMRKLVQKWWCFVPVLILAIPDLF